MPTGVPRKPKYGMRKSGCSASVMAYIDSFSWPSSPSNPALVGLQPERGRLREAAEPDRLGDAALAADPLDVVVGEAVEELPVERAGAAPVNQSSPSPLTRIPKLRQLIVIAVTTLRAATSRAASAMAFAAAIDSRRNE